MRVIAGDAKGKQLKSVVGKNTRPTTDKVKEALFSMISSYLNGGVLLDLFAGTGGLGVEALSRGMEKGIFIDRNKNSIDTIKLNIHNCGLEDRTEVYRNDAFRALKVLAKRGIIFNLVFLDPPYKMNVLEKIIIFLDENKMVSEKGIIVTEHDAKEKMPDSIGTFTSIKSNLYGNIGITIYKNQ